VDSSTALSHIGYIIWCAQFDEGEEDTYVQPTISNTMVLNFCRVAKFIGDTRAVVAEKGFNRPYSKVLISKSGEIR
jgi:hypothetical protein